MLNIEKLINEIQITSLDLAAKERAQKRFNDLIKPLGSLAKLEDMVCLYAGVRGELNPKTLGYPKRKIFIVSDDRLALTKFMSRTTPLSILCESTKSVLEGIAFLDGEGDKYEKAFLQGFASASKAIVEEHLELVGIGASASKRLPSNWDELKAADGYELLETIGDLQVAGLCGVILACAANKVPIMLDGLVSLEAAYVAARLVPEALAYCIASQVSTENGQEDLIEELGLSAVLRLNIMQGVGEGAALAFALFDAGIKAFTEMETFAEAGVHVEVEEFSQAALSKKG